MPQLGTESFYKCIFNLFIQRYLPLVGHSFDGDEMTVLEIIQNWFIQVELWVYIFCKCVHEKIEATYIVTSLCNVVGNNLCRYLWHILSPESIYCLRRQYMPISILFSQAMWATIYVVQFDTSSRRWQNMPSSFKQIVANKFETTIISKYLDIHIV